MRTITLEEHFTTPKYVAATSHSPLEAGANPRLQAIQTKQADLGEGRLADMDEAGIDLQVLSLSGILLDQLDAAVGTEIAEDANNVAAAAVRSYPDRFAAFAALALKEPTKAADELKRSVEVLGFKGGIVNGTTNGLFLDNPFFRPVFKAANRLGVPIYLHPAPPPRAVQEAYYSGLPAGYGFPLSIAGWGWHVETGLHALRLILSGLFDRLPELQIIVGHMGENLPFSIARSESVIANADKPPARPLSEYLRLHFHITTSGYFTLPPFVCAQSVIGTDRLLFSVDYPFSSNLQGREFLDSLPVSAEEKEMLAHGNAERLLKL